MSEGQQESTASMMGAIGGGMQWMQGLQAMVSGRDDAGSGDSEARRVLEASTHYEVLGLQEDCTSAQVKKAFLQLAVKLHPDKNPSQHAAAAVQCVVEAKNCLSNDDKRKGTFATQNFHLISLIPHG
tara:strand:- start:1465 stop:1845 length:381 start_codon:yes stop_codon:yes gene_type:complete